MIAKYTIYLTSQGLEFVKQNRKKCNGKLHLKDKTFNFLVEIIELSHLDDCDKKINAGQYDIGNKTEVILLKKYISSYDCNTY